MTDIIGRTERETAMMQSMLTTTDNPHDPFDDFDTWHAWDTSMGYNTVSFLARICVSSHDLTDADYQLAIDRAIDEIVAENVNGLYKKVTRLVPDELAVTE